MHLCRVPGCAHFEDHFRARYDAKDSTMFISEFLQFDVDDEYDAIMKAKKFVQEVSRPLKNLPTRIT